MEKAQIRRRDQRKDDNSGDRQVECTYLEKK
jgi:hypothetical protein